jgi:Tol biopolymer transport system component
MGTKVLFTALGVCLYLISFSQNKDTFKETFEEAEYYILYEDYQEALVLYMDLHNKGLDNAYIKHRIGECYLQISGQKEKSIPFLEEACNNLSDDIKEGSIKETKAPFRTLFYLACAYQQNNELEKAIETFKKFEGLVASTKNYNIDYVYKQIQSCNAAKDLISKPKEVHEINIGKYINDQFSNIRPVISADEKSMVYMSKLKFYDAIFYTVKKDDDWTTPVNITPDLNSEGDVYPCFLSADGKTLLLYKEENFTSDIYISYLRNNKWSAPVKLNKHINSRFQETFASLSCDGKTLFFVSDRKGGFGGTDIYKSQFDEKTQDWGVAINLGSEINTPFNEETPILCQDNKKLYFSSEGHYNMGGFDIFYSENIEQNVWSKPTNMGYPVNTTEDNLFYYPVENGNKAYISKYDENGFGQEDIVKLELNASAQR